MISADLYSVVILLLLRVALGQLECGNSTLVFHTQNNGTITFDSHFPAFRFQYPNNGFFVDCVFDSVSQMDSDEGTNPVYVYPLAKNTFNVTCEPTDSNSDDISTTTWVVTMKTFLPNNATFQIRFILWPENATDIFIDPNNDFITSGPSFQIESQISHFPAKNAQVAAILSTSAGILDIFPGYYSNGYLATVEVTSPLDNLALHISNLAEISINGTTKWGETFIDTYVEGLSPPSGKLSVVIKDTEEAVSKFSTLLEFKVHHVAQSFVIALSVGISVGVCCFLLVCGGVFFVVWKRHPELHGGNSSEKQKLRGSHGSSVHSQVPLDDTL